MNSVKFSSTMETYEIMNCTTSEQSFTNRAILHPNSSFAKVEHICVRHKHGKPDAFIFSVASDSSIKPDKIAFNSASRKWASLSVGGKVEVGAYQFSAQQCLTSITLVLDFLQGKTVDEDFDTDDMARQFIDSFLNQAFTINQLLGFPYLLNKRTVIFEAKVKNFEAVALDGVEANLEIGLTSANTIIMFEAAPGSSVRLVGKLGKTAAPKIFNHNWDLSAMGVGGLSEQFNDIFRRAFVSRLVPPQFAQSFGVEHVRGILLYGPPGTGKTLIARQIGQMLFAREPKIVNGPEVLNKYVGESEANIRKLFQEALDDQSKLGIQSPLHVIIFDEIDAICKSRGSSATTTGVGDNVVNQLLTMIDGPKSLHNILLIGMTNRRDLIDEALLRPGRLEVQIEIGLPNEQGRLEIFKIHTASMRKQDGLDSSVSLEELAELTRNYSGAEIKGLIKSATSTAFNRVYKPENNGFQIDQLENIKVTRDDFLRAMETDVKPALGASEDQLNILAKPIIQWDPLIAGIQSKMKRIISDVSTMDNPIEEPFYVLLLGKHGSGLTTLASNMALQTGFPFIRIYQDADTADHSEHSKVSYLKKLFNDAERSELSCIVMDGLEVILDYGHIGPTFSKTSRAVFSTGKRSLLPKNHRMLVICTCTSKQFLEDLKLFEVFDDILRVPSLTEPDQLQLVLNHKSESDESPFTQNQTRDLIDQLRSIPFEIGIKRLESLIRGSFRVDPNDRVNEFIERMHRLGLICKPSRFDRPFEF